MDVEVEEVAKLLFPDGVPETWKDSNEVSNYIVQLASCGVEKLGKEGAHLREERTAILDQTKDLAYTNYKTFIHTADCSKTIYNDFTSVESHLEGLSSRLPTLRSRVDNFLATSRNLAQSRHLTSLTLTRHTQLLEILELPQLMDTCVRNGYYEEALEILAYVRRLEKKHTDIPIIAGIVMEVQAGTRLMLSQLLAQLRSPLTLPHCLKIIGLLRRLDVFTEPELRLKFLQARDSWFNGILKAIAKNDAYHHIIKVVEASRVHLFDIVTQYRAIFTDDDTRFTLADPEVNEQAIFHGWVLHKVNQFLGLVEMDLERGVGNNLEAVLAQCMFFGQSFSRIGADFRNLLIPLFQNAALLQCEKNIRTANIKFDETLSSFSLMEAQQLTSSSFMGETQDKTRPPLGLMEFPPLAHYLNGLVATFNILRQCCPTATLPAVIKLLHNSLSKVVGAVVELHRLESSGFTVREDAAFQRLCSVLAHHLLPHVNKCLHLLYPLQQISLITGVPITQLQRENFGQLNLEELLLPMEHLLPKKEETELGLEDQLGAINFQTRETPVIFESHTEEQESDEDVGIEIRPKGREDEIGKTEETKEKEDKITEEQVATIKEEVAVEKGETENVEIVETIGPHEKVAVEKGETENVEIVETQGPQEEVAVEKGETENVAIVKTKGPQEEVAVEKGETENVERIETIAPQEVAVEKGETENMKIVETKGPREEVVVAEERFQDTEEISPAGIDEEPSSNEVHVIEDNAVVDTNEEITQ